ncbi:hypothetical protein [Kribbella endophytica]
MRRVALTAVAGLVLTLGLVSPAAAADPAPTNVKVAWSSAAHTHVRVTWDEVGDRSNWIIATYPGGSAPHSSETAAGAPNQVDVPVSDFLASTSVRMSVAVTSSGASTTSPGGLSAPFDTLQRGVIDIDQLTAVPGGNTFTMKWHSGPDPVDPNPGDALDLAVGPHRYQVFASKPNYVEWSAVSQTGPATTATFTTPDAPPINVGVRDYNEWSGVPAWTSLDVDGGALDSVTIPASTTYGQATVISGWFVRSGRRCDKEGCWSGPIGQHPRTVALQARANAASPWYVVGTVQTDGAFRFAPVAWGTREYRVAVPDYFADGSLGMGAISKSVNTLTRPRVVASFAATTVKLGQAARARISVSPAVNVRSTLQRWDGNVWRDLKWVDLKSGWGDYTFAATQRGSHAYRFLVPSFTYGGRPIAWQVSPNFVLTAS